MPSKLKKPRIKAKRRKAGRPKLPAPGTEESYLAVLLEDIRAKSTATIEAVELNRQVTDDKFADLGREMATKFEILTTALRDTRDEVRKNSADIRTNSEDIRKNSEDIRKNSEDIRKNSEDIRKNSEDIRALGDRVDSLAMRVEVLGERTERLEGRVTVVESRVGSSPPAG